MKNRKTQVFLLTLYAYFAIGCMVLTVNTALKTIIVEYGWSDAQGGLLISFLSMGNLAASMLAGFVAQRLGRRRTMMLYGALIALSYTLFALLPSPQLFYPLMLLAGFAWGGINSLDNTIVSELYDGSASRLNVLHSFYAAGAVVAPLVLGFILQQGGSWRLPVWAVAALGLGLTLLSVLIPIPEPASAQKEGGKHSAVAFYKEIGFYLGVIMFFTYVGVETAACAWLSGYLAQTNAFFQQVPSETMVSLMWLTMIVGRLTFAAVGMKLNKQMLLILLSCGFLLGMLGIIYGSGSTVLAIASVAFMGLSMSAMYAVCVANNARYVACSPVASGILFGGGGLGAAAVPYLAGIVSDHAGMQKGMLSLCAFLVVLIIASILNLKNHRSAENG